MTTPPLWVRWILSVLGVVALTVAIVVFIHSSANSVSSNDSPAAEQQADEEGQAVQQQDQAPHSAAFNPAHAPTAALERAIGADMRSRVAQGNIGGPVQRVSCHTRQVIGGRLAFQCQALAGGFEYPFDAVADRRTRQLTWCKDDSAAVEASVETEISPACLPAPTG